VRPLHRLEHTDSHSALSPARFFRHPYTSRYRVVVVVVVPTHSCLRIPLSPVPLSAPSPVCLFACLPTPRCRHVSQPTIHLHLVHNPRSKRNHPTAQTTCALRPLGALRADPPRADRRSRGGLAGSGHQRGGWSRGGTEGQGGGGVCPWKEHFCADCEWKAGQVGDMQSGQMIDDCEVTRRLG
jgi:hypothetical protein